MENRRHITNPSKKQNEDLYEVVSFNPKKAGDVVGDYYLKSHRPFGTTMKYKEGCENAGFHLRTTQFPTGNQHCITIKDENIRKVFLNIEWENYLVKGISWDYILKNELHQAFNEEYNNGQ